MAALSVLGFAMLFIGGIWLLVVAFRTNILWGIGSLLLPIIGLLFVMTHWQDAKKPFLWQLAGVVVFVMAGSMGHFAPGIGGDCRIKGNIGFTTGERIYHVPGDKWYDKTRIDTSKGERWFCSEEEARAAGWRRSYG